MTAFIVWESDFIKSNMIKSVLGTFCRFVKTISDLMDEKTERLIQLIKQAQIKYSSAYLVIAVPGFISKKFVAYCSMKEDLEATHLVSSP